MTSNDLRTLLARYGGPGPRYTSYPSALEFDTGVRADDYRSALSRAGASIDPLSLYVHVPFCRSLCLYCGCNVIITQNEGRKQAYVDTLRRELRLVGEALGSRRRVAQLHFGGGSPNALSRAQLGELFAAVWGSFEPTPGAEVGVETDPRILDEATLDLFRSLGVNRMSIGVQDFDPAVQEAIGRRQPEARTRALFAYARRAGFDSLSLDLLIGLPRQTIASFGRTLDAVVAMAPHRISVFPYAHVPWLRPHQRVLERAGLPGPDQRLALALFARDRLVAEGYVSIGIDHFALPEDGLAVALRERRLHRNFQGYTVGPARDLVGVGVTSISDVDGTYAQNLREERQWAAAVSAGTLPTERGRVLDRDDLLRREIIRAILCDFRVDVAQVERRWGISFADELSEELAALGPLESDGLVVVEPDAIELTETGHLFARAVAMAFDAYSIDRMSAGRPAFSRIA